MPFVLHTIRKNTLNKKMHYDCSTECRIKYKHTRVQLTKYPPRSQKRRHFIFRNQKAILSSKDPKKTNPPKKRNALQLFDKIPHGSQERTQVQLMKYPDQKNDGIAQTECIFRNQNGFRLFLKERNTYVGMGMGIFSFPRLSSHSHLRFFFFFSLPEQKLSFQST